MSPIIEEIISLLEPLVVAWVKYLVQSGKDPATELEALMTTAETQAKAVEDAKFPPAT
jgi:hypothetical protein